MEAVESVEWQSEHVMMLPGVHPPFNLAAVSWLPTAKAVPTGWREALFGLNSNPRSVHLAAAREDVVMFLNQPVAPIALE